MYAGIPQSSAVKASAHMLVLNRKASERIVIGDDIEILICGINRDRVKVGINAPADVRIMRAELLTADNTSGKSRPKILAAER